VKEATEEAKGDALQALEHLLESYKTVSLATRSPSGDPQVSYTPGAWDHHRRLYLFVSELSDHTENLRHYGNASVMVIEDESASKQLFARNRLTLEGEVTHIPRESDEWDEAAQVYRDRFGKFFDQLSQLRDFHMYVFEPRQARLVVGFGAAYEVKLPHWTRLELVTGK